MVHRLCTDASVVYNCRPTLITDDIAQGISRTRQHEKEKNFLEGGFLWEIARYEHMLTTIIISQIIECKETAILLFHCYFTLSVIDIGLEMISL